MTGLCVTDWEEGHVEAAAPQREAVLHKGEWKEGRQISGTAASGQPAEPLPYWRLLE